MPSIRSLISLSVLALVLFSSSALTGALPVGPQSARAADEPGEEPTTTPEEPPPVVETPTEPETTPTPETPTMTPPVTTPPVGSPSDNGGALVETPKSTPSTGSGSGGASGGGGGSSSGPAGSGSTSTSTSGAATSPASSPSRHTSRPPSSSGGSGVHKVGGGRLTPTHSSGGGGSSDTGSGGASAGGRTPSASPSPSHSGGGGAAPQPTVSPQAIDRGASVVTNAASHVGEAFAKALPTAPLKKIGDQLAAHIAAGAGAAQGGKDPKQAVDGIGKALGAALIGSAVAVDRTPAANNSPIPFFDPPGGKSGTVYLVLIAVLLLGVGALVVREARSALGWDAPRTGVRVADEKPRIALRERVGVTLAGAREASDRWFSRFRRMRANAAAGLRSLF